MQAKKTRIKKTPLLKANSKAVTKLLVGVGNPGDGFYMHRHNIGFRAIDLIAEELEVSFDYDKKKSIFGKKEIKDDLEIILLKPQTFIDLSGEAILYIASFLKVDISNILIIFDDINLNFGEIEIKSNSKEISHSAVKHIEISLNNDKFFRLAFGIGPLPNGSDLDAFYLNPFTNKEEKRVPSLLKKASKFCTHFLNKPAS